MDDSSQSVKVAVHIRPLVTSELIVGCCDCITVFPVEKQVQIGSHAFTYDYVFGGKGLPSFRIYDECVSPLVDALFHGYNSTVLAYGQTGSGKTYTMGTNYNGEDHKDGIIPKVIETIFSKVASLKESTEFLIRVSFIEIFKEEVYDLLDPHSHMRNDSTSMVKNAGPARTPIQIRETASGGITLAGVTDAEVRTKEELASYLLQGSLCRATGSTNMNSQSSRSHAIFTIAVEQRRITHSSTGEDVGDDILIAKLHLVDLAGSERAKRTGANGMRLQEGIHINKGLLSLGNVISALGDERKRKEGGHVPYRDSKLTRILQDSLGGNSKTIMIACVSPADTNTEETLNTLKYANRTRNIQNKAIVNRDPVTAQMQRMRSQIEQLQAELLYFRGDSSAPTEDIKILKHKISLLEQSKLELQEELQECRTGYKHLTQCAIDAQVERDRLLLKVESIQSGKTFDENDSEKEKDFDIMKSYITKIQELEVELLRLRNSNHSRHDDYANSLATEDDGIHSTNPYLMDSDINALGKVDEAEDVEKELEHSSLQEKLDNELKELDKKLEQKEAEMKRVASWDTSVLKQHYEKKVQDLELEKRALQKEIDDLRQNLASISTHSGDSAQRVKEEYLQKLNVLEKQVAELKKKQDAQAQTLRQKQKSDEAAKRLQDEIHRIKTQKVQLQQKIKQESEQFRQWKASREKEVLQLKKEGRRNEFEMHKLLSLNQRQKQVLQRKTEEAAAATKRLKELLDSRKSSREATSVGNSNAPGIQALVQAIEHELEVTVRVHEVQSEYERQIQERSRMAEEIARLKEEAHIEKKNLSGGFPETMSPGARNSRIYALENMLATTSSALVSMASQLSEAEEREREAEERERAFNGRGRWNQVRSLPEAKHIMNHLLNLASSSRCQLRDREVDCREKDSEIRDLKDKVVNLVRQLESHKAEFIRQENAMKLTMKRLLSKEVKDGSRTGLMNNTEGHAYDLRQTGYRNSMIFSSGINGAASLEDMDTSEDVQEEIINISSDSEWERTRKRKKRPMRKLNSKGEDNNLQIAIYSENSSSETLIGQACCTCSKSSLCKTSRCECRAAGGGCGFSCSCEITRCSNRDWASGKGLEQPEVLEAFGNMSIADGNKKTNNLASHGAMLLQSALSEKPSKAENEDATRKPLSDIGNSIARSSSVAPNTKGRRKWRKSVIQLVPAKEPEIQIGETAQLKNHNVNGEIEIPSKIPRPMCSTLPNNNQLKDRNSDQTTTESVVQLVSAKEPEIQIEGETAQLKNHNGNGEIEIPSKIPKPMRSTLPNNNQLKDRNSDQTTTESVDKDSLQPLSLGSPQAKTKHGKENEEH